MYQLRVEDHQTHPHRDVTQLHPEVRDARFSTAQEAGEAATATHRHLKRQYADLVVVAYPSD